MWEVINGWDFGHPVAGVFQKVAVVWDPVSLHLPLRYGQH